MRTFVELEVLMLVRIVSKCLAACLKFGRGGRFSWDDFGVDLVETAVARCGSALELMDHIVGFLR